MSFGDEGRLDSSQLTGEEKPSLSGSDETIPVPLVVFRLR
jgi:hypothetical protein